MTKRKLLSLFFMTLMGEGTFLPAFTLAAEQAASVYKNFCASCHGAKGKGDGPASSAFNPRPQDLCESKIHSTDADMYKMIAEGGPSMGHPPGMISFGGSLDKETIKELVAYIRSFCKK